MGIGHDNSPPNVLQESESRRPQSAAAQPASPPSPLQPAAQLAVGLPPPPATAPPQSGSASPPPTHSHQPPPRPSQPRFPQLNQVDDPPPSYSAVAFQSLPKYSEIFSV